jgi:hypothetical protein
LDINRNLKVNYQGQLATKQTEITTLESEKATAETYYINAAIQLAAKQTEMGILTSATEQAPDEK